MGDKSGSADHPTAETLAQAPSSEARVGGAEARGRPTRKCRQGEDRVEVTLGRMESSLGKGKKASTKKSRPKNKGEGGNQAGKVRSIWNFFEERLEDRPPI